jgi:methionyl-tRNA formyltransferase
MNLIFMGTPAFAVVAMEALHRAGHVIRAVYTQPPRPAQRGQKEQRSPVHLSADRLCLQVRTPKSLRDPAAQAELAAFGADLAVVAAYGLILPQAVLDLFPRGCLNIHASLLPRWRGAAPIQRAILAGDAETGVCIMAMEAGLDTGPVYARGAIPIMPHETAGALHDRLAQMGAQMIVYTLEWLDLMAPKPQPDVGVTYAAKIDKSETRLDFTQPADQLTRVVRAFSPVPGAWLEAGGERIKVLAALAEPGRATDAPGQVVDDAFGVATREGVFRPTRVQRAGRAPMTTAELLRGFALPVGTRLS